MRVDLIVKGASSGSSISYRRLESGGHWTASAVQSEPGDVPLGYIDDSNIKFVDINGDRRLDLMYTPTSERWVYWLNLGVSKTGKQRWRSGNFSVPTAATFATHKTADMNGDGLQDVIITRSGGATYWPSTGNGRWGDAVKLVALRV